MFNKSAQIKAALLRNKSNIAIILLLVLILVLVVFSKDTIHEEPQQSFEDEIVDTSSNNHDIIEADILGTGTPQTIIISQTPEGISFKIRDEFGNIITKELSGASTRLSSNYSAVKLDVNSPTEYIQWDLEVGHHHTETYFLTVQDSELVSIPSNDTEKQVWYEPFWTSRDFLVVGDMDGDGLVEIIEFVDEFPPDAPRLEDEDVRQSIIDAYEELGYPSRVANDSWKIYSRENEGLGRGRKVIWGIHTFIAGDSPSIRRLTEAEFNEKAQLIKDMSAYMQSSIPAETAELLTEIISRNDLSQESIYFNEFVRDFWTEGVRYEKEIVD